MSDVADMLDAIDVSDASDASDVLLALFYNLWINVSPWPETRITKSQKRQIPEAPAGVQTVSSSQQHKKQ